MTFKKPLPQFNPRSIPVLGIDDHLAEVAPERLTPQSLRERFRHPPVWTPEHSGERKYSDRKPALAAVLLPLVMRDELTLLLTVRALNLSTHSGHIALPGGRTDATDQDAIATALREAHEEIGLPRGHVEVLGTLPTYVTGSAFIITPVVALVKPGFVLQPNPGEVADITAVTRRRSMACYASGSPCLTPIPWQRLTLANRGSATSGARPPGCCATSIVS